VKKRESGFICAGRMELRIVVAVIGCAMAVAIPAWHDYRARTGVNEGIERARAAHDAVAKAFAANGPADMSLSGYLKWTPPATTEDVQSVSIGKNGWINIVYTEKIARSGENELQIVPVAKGKALDLSDPASKGAKFEWQCGGAAGRTTVPAKYLPKDCRPLTYGDTGEDGRLREKVRQTLEGATASRTVIYEYFRQHRKFPPDLKTRSNMRYDAKSGSLVVHLPERMTLEGPVVLVPSSGDGDKLEWHCKGAWSPKQDRRHLPEECG
jgi:type II secretory pathway pseudopilin PulG